MDREKGPDAGHKATAASSSSVSASEAANAPQNVRRRPSVLVNGPDIPRESATSEQSMPEVPHVVPPEFPSELPPGSRPSRRSSTFSSFSFSEANRDFQEEILDPGPSVQARETTWKSWLPFVFAILPPAAGLVFKNGTAIFGDMILLSLVAVFLNWSITAPWKWYYAAQQIREGQSAAPEQALDVENDQFSARSGGSESPRGTSTSNEEKGEGDRRAADDALSRLRFFEVMALCLCFIAPAGSTYLLYVVRDLLSRGSESLVSSFNLGIFLLAAEIGPCSHAIKLVLARTLHLQRVVHASPYRTVRITPEKYRDMLLRIEQLEARVLQEPDKGVSDGVGVGVGVGGGGGGGSPGGCTAGCQCNDAQKQRQLEKAASEIALRKIMADVGPRVEAITRAVRRYERKLDTFSNEVEERLWYIRQRLDDSITLSASMARRADGPGVARVIARVAMFLATLPVFLAGRVVSLVFWPARALVRAVGYLFGGRGATDVATTSGERPWVSGANGTGRERRAEGVTTVSIGQAPARSATSNSVAKPASIPAPKPALSSVSKPTSSLEPKPASRTGPRTQPKAT